MLKEWLKTEIKHFFALEKSPQGLWHIPFIAIFGGGVPLFLGLYFDRLAWGFLAYMGCWVVLCMPLNRPIRQQAYILLSCSLGFVLCMILSLLLDVHPVLAVIGFGVSMGIAQWMCLHFNIPAPSLLLFITIFSLGGNASHDTQQIIISASILLGGALFGSLVAIIYLSFPHPKIQLVFPPEPPQYAHIVYASITAFFMSLSLAVGFLLAHQYPYWIPFSSAVIIQQANMSMVWRKTLHRFVGTIVGLVICWWILSIPMNGWEVCVFTLVAQFIVMLVIPKNYAIAVTIITPLSLLSVVMTARHAHADQFVNELISMRFFEVSIGAVIGLVGGWLIHQEKIQRNFALAIYGRKKHPTPKQSS